VNLALATNAGLKGHRLLIGRSALANGELKLDYLCPALISVLGVDVPLVVKVSPEQQNLLGLDAMFLLDMELHIVKGEFSIVPKPLSPKETQFQFIDIPGYLKKLNLTSTDLIPVEDLPPIKEVYLELVNAGKTGFVIDLGATFSSTIIPITSLEPKIINLGTC
jgi:hypothetical protein